MRSAPRSVRAVQRWEISCPGKYEIELWMEADRDYGVHPHLLDRLGHSCAVETTLDPDCRRVLVQTPLPVVGTLTLVYRTA